jgi:hypothetical protein
LLTEQLKTVGREDARLEGIGVQKAFKVSEHNVPNQWDWSYARQSLDVFA